MRQHDSNRELMIVETPPFEVPVTTLEWRGQPVWLAGDVSTGLEYGARSDSSGKEGSVSKRVQDAIRDEWAEDFTEGVDFHIVKGDDLRAFKALGVVGANAPSVMLLTESGFYMVAVLSRTEGGRKLRRWLVDEVLPSIRRTGTYTAPVRSDATAIRLARELRLGGDKAGSLALLRAHSGLEPLPVPPAPPRNAAHDRFVSLVWALYGDQDWTAGDIANRVESGDLPSGWTVEQAREVLGGLGAWDADEGMVNRRVLGGRVSAMKGDRIAPVPKRNGEEGQRRARTGKPFWRVQRLS